METEISRVVKLQSIENWCIWKFQVRVLLQASNFTIDNIYYNAWNVVQGINTAPEAPAIDTTQAIKIEYEKKLAAYQKADASAQRIMVTTIAEQPTLHIINCETAKEMWDKLVSIYEQKSQVSVHVLQQKWFTAVKDSSDDLATHITKIENLAHRLQLMGETVTDSMIVTKILLTLPPGYNHFVSAWESTSANERTKENLISRLAAEELRQSNRADCEESAFTSSLHSDKNKKFMDEFYGMDKVKVILHVDNQSAIQLIKNPLFHKRTKHIDIQYKYIREKFFEKKFEVQYISTDNQKADILTKPLPRQLFERHREDLCCSVENHLYE